MSTASIFAPACPTRDDDNSGSYRRGRPGHPLQLYGENGKYFTKYFIPPWFVKITDLEPPFCGFQDEPLMIIIHASVPERPCEAVNEKEGGTILPLSFNPQITLKAV